MLFIEHWRDLALASAGAIGVIVALAHGVIMHRIMVRPLNEVIGSKRLLSRAGARLVSPLLHVSTFTWFAGGLALIVAAARLHGEARLIVCLLVGCVYLYAAAMNAWATGGRHVGWMLMAVALVLMAAGATESQQPFDAVR